MILTKLWYQKNPLFYLLVPFSGLYRLAIALKKLSYRLGWKKITRLPVPVIVIGNLTVGGTGKTPLIIALAMLFIEHGYRPGIVSRGYGAKTKKFPQQVSPHSDPEQVGDEPVLIARNTFCPVVVDPNRVNAAQTLLEQSNCNIILSDDGLQHTALGRDIEIVVVDGARRFGNGFCLPAGPLREPITRLQQVDFIVTRGHAQTGEWKMQLVPGAIYSLQQPQDILAPSECKQPIHAVAGIGNPDVFFEQLRGLGFTVIPHPFPDHYLFTTQDIDFGADAIVIMTEKDAVKCQKFTDHRHWCLPVTAECSPLAEQLLQRLTTVLK